TARRSRPFSTTRSSKAFVGAVSPWTSFFPPPSATASRSSRRLAARRNKFNLTRRPTRRSFGVVHWNKTRPCKTMEVRQSMARDWYGPIERFGDAFKARRKLWVLCKECGHTALADPRDLLVRLGDITLERAGRKLRCQR